MAPIPRVVLDTNVLVAGLRSRRGASFRLLSEVGRGKFEIALSVPLVLEYEDALLRHAAVTGLSTADVDAVLDYLCHEHAERTVAELASSSASGAGRT